MLARLELVAPDLRQPVGGFGGLEAQRRLDRQQPGDLGGRARLRIGQREAVG